MPAPIRSVKKIDRKLFDVYAAVEERIRLLGEWKREAGKQIKAAVRAGSPVDAGIVCEERVEDVRLEAGDWRRLVLHFWLDEADDYKKKFAIALKQSPQFRASTRFVFALEEVEAAETDRHLASEAAEGAA